MGQTVNAVTVIVTKQTSGTVQFLFQNALGGIIFAVAIPYADLASIHTVVNGGGAGTTLTKTYSQDLNRLDYPQHYVHGEGN